MIREWLNWRWEGVTTQCHSWPRQAGVSIQPVSQRWNDLVCVCACTVHPFWFNTMDFNGVGTKLMKWKEYTTDHNVNHNQLHILVTKYFNIQYSTITTLYHKTNHNHFTVLVRCTMCNVEQPPWNHISCVIVLLLLRRASTECWSKQKQQQQQKHVCNNIL